MGRKFLSGIPIFFGIELKSTNFWIFKQINFLFSIKGTSVDCLAHQNPAPFESFGDKCEPFG